MVDVLEAPAPSDVLMVIEAPRLLKLLQLTIRALACVEAYTESIQAILSRGDELSSYTNRSPPSEVINSGKYK